MSKAMDSKVAIQKMLHAGLKPLEPYVSTATPWRSRCLKCKSEVFVRLNNLSKVKVACVYCSGNAIHEKDAIAAMKKAGLKPLVPYPGSSKPWKSLDWIRTELGFGQYLLAEQMPQGGHTETFGLDEIELDEVWNKVIEVSRLN